jgi:hypothetical protein
MALLCASLSVASTCLPIRRVTTSSSHQLDDIRRRVAADDRLKRPCPSIERPALLCRPIVALVDPDNPGPTSGYMVQDGLGYFEADSKPLQIGRERPAAVAKSSPALLGDRRRGPRLPPASARRSNHRSSPSAVVYFVRPRLRSGAASDTRQRGCAITNRSRAHARLARGSPRAVWLGNLASEKTAELRGCQQTQRVWIPVKQLRVAGADRSSTASRLTIIVLCAKPIERKDPRPPAKGQERATAQASGRSCRCRRARLDCPKLESTRPCTVDERRSASYRRFFRIESGR